MISQSTRGRTFELDSTETVRTVHAITGVVTKAGTDGWIARKAGSNELTRHRTRRSAIDFILND